MARQPTLINPSPATYFGLAAPAAKAQQTASKLQYLWPQLMTYLINSITVDNRCKNHFEHQPKSKKVSILRINGPTGSGENLERKQVEGAEPTLFEADAGAYRRLFKQLEIK